MPAPVSMLLAPPHASSSTSWRRCIPSSGAFARSPSPPASTMSAGPLAVAADHAGERDGLPSARLPSDFFRTELRLPEEDDAPPSSSSSSSLLSALPVRHRHDDEEIPAYPAAMNALYAACLAGDVTEHLWNFTWPAAVAALHPSLLPVAVLGFFSKLVVFAAGPLVGDLISSLPRIPAYRYLSAIQTAAHLVSAAMITHAFAVPRAPAAAPELLLRPWFAVLVAATAVDRLACISLGVAVEREFVVQLAGAGRPVALAQANAMLSRVDLICETAGASIFAVLLSNNDPLTCIRLSCIISLCALPLQIFLGGAMNRLAGGIFDRSTCPQQSGRPQAAWTFNIRRIAEDAWATVRHGWSEYAGQPVLPASLAYVLLCFNVALAPSALMTTFLIHHGVSPSVLGAFGGSSALVGILATFVHASLVREVGVLRAGAAGLVAQSALLGAAVFVYLAGAVSRPGGAALFVFLGLIVASRLGHMAYSLVGLQVVQTGNPVGKAKLIGATEIAVASLAELAMMAVAVAAGGDAAHFGSLAALSAAAVAAAACLYCCWLVNPTDELRRLFPS